jgi:hypothetical protein
MPRAVDQHPVQTLPAHGAYPSFRVRVRPRRRRWTSRTSTPSLLNTSSKTVVYLVSRSRIRNRNCPARSPRSTIRLRACCTTHSPLAWVVTPRMCTRRLRDLHQEQHVDTRQPDRVDVQEIAGKDPLGLRAQELRPGRPRPPRSGIHPGLGQDRPHGTGRHPVAQADQFTLNPAMAPARSLLGQAQHQRPNLSLDRRATRPASGIRPGRLGHRRGHVVGVNDSRSSTNAFPA